MVQDVTEAIVTLLKADATITSLVNTRVFGAELPASEAVNMPRKNLVVQRSGGPAGLGGYIEVERANIDIRCFGETPLEADKVRRAAHEVLKQYVRTKVGDVLVHSFIPVTGAISLRDPDTQWPFVIQTWTFMASEVQAT